MEGAAHLLDIGGGDGTIALALVDAYKSQSMKATVFNLEASAEFARENIVSHDAAGKVDVVVGNFLDDDLPSNGVYDRVMFSRVLTDWDASTCRMLLQKAKNVLLQTKRQSGRDGKLVINEAFMEGNEYMCAAWEFRYIFYDTFGRAVYKSVDTYRSILKEVGFEVVSVSSMLDSAFYSVITAQLAAETA